MNCKPGDLAVIVNSDAGNLGKIVRCIRITGTDRWTTPTGHVKSSPTWLIDRELASWCGSRSNRIADDQLRPIRDPGEDAKDETLQWLPVPSRDEVPA